MRRRRIRVGDLLMPFIYTAVIPVFIVVFVYELSRGGPEGRIKRHTKAHLKIRRKIAPLPLPDRPPVSQAFDPKLNCDSPLLRLPFELRLHIYSYAVGGDVLHMVQLRRRLAHVRCVSGLADPWRKCICAARREDQDQYLKTRPYRPASLSSNLGLLLACRQTFAEAVDLLYSANTFDVSNLDVIIYLAQTVRPEYLRRITRLQLDWSLSGADMPLHRAPFSAPSYLPSSVPPHDYATWEAFWEIVAHHMWSLSHLKVHLSDFVLAAGHISFFAPMMLVRGLKSLVLRMPDFEDLYEFRLALPPLIPAMTEAMMRPHQRQEDGSRLDPLQELFSV